MAPAAVTIVAPTNIGSRKRIGSSGFIFSFKPNKGLGVPGIGRETKQKTRKEIGRAPMGNSHALLRLNVRGSMRSTNVYGIGDESIGESFNREGFWTGCLRRHELRRLPGAGSQSLSDSMGGFEVRHWATRLPHRHHRSSIERCTRF